jgi:hypothetical protein
LSFIGFLPLIYTDLKQQKQNKNNPMTGLYLMAKVINKKRERESGENYNNAL